MKKLIPLLMLPVAMLILAATPAPNPTDVADLPTWHINRGDVLSNGVWYVGIMTTNVANPDYSWWWFIAQKAQQYGAALPVSRVDLGQKMDSAAELALTNKDYVTANRISRDASWLLTAWAALQGDTRPDSFWTAPPPQTITTNITVTNPVAQP